MTDQPSFAKYAASPLYGLTQLLRGIERIRHPSSRHIEQAFEVLLVCRAGSSQQQGR
jgi:hypothetical protein